MQWKANEIKFPFLLFRTALLVAPHNIEEGLRYLLILMLCTVKVFMRYREAQS